MFVKQNQTVIVVINTPVAEPAIVEVVAPHVVESILSVTVRQGMVGVEVLVQLVVLLISTHVVAQDILLVRVQHVVESILSVTVRQGMVGMEVLVQLVEVIIFIVGTCPDTRNHELHHADHFAE